MLGKCEWFHGCLKALKMKDSFFIIILFFLPPWLSYENEILWAFSTSKGHSNITLRMSATKLFPWSLIEFLLCYVEGNCSPSFHLTFALLDFPGAGKDLIIKSRNLLSSRNLTSKIILITLITFNVILPGNCLHIWYKSVHIRNENSLKDT